ncbi:MAG TPA: sodium:proton antiporter NhaD [Ferruginibacter sp.]|jgi:Na+/H+ antiporter NhaD/arsenite permease-like protein|nr:sodium:proton antiporter NhaD [Ferruginibacter sp.]
MISVLLITVFVLGYIAIAFEHPLKLNKAASALITGVVCWTIYILKSQSADSVTDELLHHLGEIASILFFLLGAMTIVELIDSHNGFDIITEKIKTTSKPKLLLIIIAITFFLSALLDNLTTAIVMTSLCSKLLREKEDRLWFVGMIVIAANAGGAWSPLGDVTTTMLWIGGQITAVNIMKQLILPSLAACIIPALIVSYRFRGQRIIAMSQQVNTAREKQEGKIILFSGIGFLIFVPLFKTVTHLPPFMGMLLALGLMWVITTGIHKSKSEEIAERYTVSRALQKIDSPSILFFLGILLAVSALQSAGLLKELATFLSNTFRNDYLIGIALGLLSAVVDNVPLVAASQGMFDLNTYPTDHPFWEFLALTTGTGGSAVIIGTAAGVAVMGIEQVDFMWYLKKIGWLALIGFAAGIAIFLTQIWLFG